MKNFLAPVTKNKVVKTVTKTIGDFYISHQNTILAGGSIGFSIATTAVTIRNAGEINRILEETRATLDRCDSKEEKNSVYALALKELAPLVTPIIIFQALTIGTIMYTKKKADDKDRTIADLAGALSVAQQAVTYYQSFQKETEEALGEKKYEKLQNDICKNQEVDGRPFSYLASEGAPGEVLIIDAYSGKPFWGLVSNVENAARSMASKLESGCCDIVTLEDYYDYIGNRDLLEDPGELASKFGYASGGLNTDILSARFADTHYVFPNGTRIPAFKAYLYPGPACVEWGC